MKGRKISNITHSSRPAWLVILLSVVALCWTANALAADQPPTAKPSKLQIGSASSDSEGDLAKSSTSNVNVPNEIQGHPLKTADEFKKLTSLHSLSDLANERRWASDTARVLAERRFELRDELQQHPSPLEMDPLTPAEYTQKYTIIQHQIHQAQQDDSDRSLDEHRRAEARARQLELTREEAQLQLKQVESERYSQRRDEFKKATDRYRLADDDLRTTNHYLSQVDDAIATALAVTNSIDTFRLWMGLTYGALVAILIGGFYFLAQKTPNIKEVLFKDDKGLQFISVFSIIIAIILLGIMNVLEGKELSALLGGLSGYILGRSNLGDRKSDASGG